MTECQGQKISELFWPLFPSCLALECMGLNLAWFGERKTDSALWLSGGKCDHHRRLGQTTDTQKISSGFFGTFIPTAYCLNSCSIGTPCFQFNYLWVLFFVTHSITIFSIDCFLFKGDTLCSWYSFFTFSGSPFYLFFEYILAYYFCLPRFF